MSPTCVVRYSALSADPNYLERLNYFDSDADLSCSELSPKGEKKLISVKLLTKYVIIIYALGSVHESSASES